MKPRPRLFVVPAPTLLEGLWFVVLWAEFTGRTEVDR